MAIVVDLQLGRSLAAVGPHDAVVELLDETRRGARDYPGDLGGGFGSCAVGQAQPMSTLTPSSHHHAREERCRAQFSLTKHVIDHH